MMWSYIYCTLPYVANVIALLNGIVLNKRQIILRKYLHVIVISLV